MLPEGGPHVIISPIMVLDGLTWREVTRPGTIFYIISVTSNNNIIMKTHTQGRDTGTYVHTLKSVCYSFDTLSISYIRNCPNLRSIPGTWFEYRCSVLSLCSIPLYSTTPTTR